MRTHSTITLDCCFSDNVRAANNATGNAADNTANFTANNTANVTDYNSANSTADITADNAAAIEANNTADNTGQARSVEGKGCTTTQSSRTGRFVNQTSSSAFLRLRLFCL